MLLRLPVSTGIVRQGIYNLIEVIAIAFLVLEVDVVNPAILTGSGIVISENVVSVRVGKVAKNLFVHDGNLAFNRSLTITLIGLRLLHDGPAADSVVIPRCKISVIRGPLVADICTVLGSERSIIIRVIAACLGSSSAVSAARLRVAVAGPASSGTVKCIRSSVGCANLRNRISQSSARGAGLNPLVDISGVTL